MTLDETRIQELFRSVLEDQRQDTESLRQVFSMLVRSTLKYRDEMLESRGVVLTVEDVRTCLGWLIPAFATGNMPDTDNRLRMGLLEFWLKELQEQKVKSKEGEEGSER